MKTQLSKPARTKASYTEEYYRPLQLWRSSGRSAAKVAAEPEIPPTTPVPLVIPIVMSARRHEGAKL